MADATTPADFQELLNSLEPRIPLLDLDMQIPSADRPAWDCVITACVLDSIHGNEFARYELDPITALNIFHKANRYSFDGQWTEDVGVWTVRLYDLCNAWFHHRVGEKIPEAKPVSCSLADAIQFVIDAHKRVNGRQLVVTIDGAHWSLL